MIGPKTLVITGGTSGIGAATVKLAAQRGYQIVYSGSRTIDGISPELRTLHSPKVHYVQADVRNTDHIRNLWETTLNLFPKGLGQVSVVACAGIAKRGSPEAVEEMRQTNVFGTQSLYEAFSPIVEDLVNNNRFIGVSSIVAAEGKPVQGDKEYQKTKQEILDFVRQKPQSFALVPGAVDTPMTNKEMIFGLLLCGVISRLNDDAALRAGLVTYMGGEDKLGTTPTDILRNIIGKDFFNSASFAEGRDYLSKFPALNKNRAWPLIAKPITDNDEIRKKVIATLLAMDLAVPPEEVARRFVDQLDSGEIPENLMLKVYSRSGDDLAGKLL